MNSTNSSNSNSSLTPTGPMYSAAGLFYMYYASQIGAYGFIPCMIIGLSLNPYTMIILLTTKELRKLRTISVLCGKMIYDCLLLLGTPLFLTIGANSPAVAATLPSWVCKLRWAVTGPLNVIQPYCILLTSIDRFIATVKPLNYKHWVTKWRMNFVFALLNVAAIGYGVLFWWAFEMRDGQCQGAVGYDYFYLVFSGMFNLIVGNVAPLALILALNVGIVGAMNKAHSRVGGAKATAQPQADGEKLKAAAARDRQRQAFQQSLTITLITEALVLVAMVMPGLASGIVGRQAAAVARQYPDYNAFISFVVNCCLLFSTGSKAINFLVFFSCFKHFRRQALSAFCKSAVQPKDYTPTKNQPISTRA